MSATLSKERGQASVAGIMATLILILITAGLVDLYRLHEVRSWAYQAASDAALAGVGSGRDYAYFMATGMISLDEGVAIQAARERVQEEMAARGIVEYVVDIRALPDPEGGSIPGYPPVPRASQWNVTSWSESEPSVGVFLVVPVETYLFGLINGNQPIQVHVFAAAGVATASLQDPVG